MVVLHAIGALCAGYAEPNMRIKVVCVRKNSLRLKKKILIITLGKTNITEGKQVQILSTELILASECSLIDA